MTDKDKYRESLYERASRERDPKKLSDLVNEILKTREKTSAQEGEKIREVTEPHVRPFQCPHCGKITAVAFSVARCSHCGGCFVIRGEKAEKPA